MLTFSQFPVLLFRITLSWLLLYVFASNSIAKELNTCGFSNLNFDEKRLYDELDGRSVVATRFADGFTERLQVSADFLEVILKSTECQRSLKAQTIELVNVDIRGNINASVSHVVKQLVSAGSVFQGDVILDQALFSFGFSLERESKVEGELSLRHATVAHDLSIEDSIIVKTLNLIDSRLLRGFRSKKAKFNAVLMERSRVGGAIIHEQSEFLSNINMSSISVGDRVAFIGGRRGKPTKIDDSITFRAARVEGQLFFWNVDLFGKLDITGAEIGQQLSMIGGSVFRKEINATALSVNGQLRTRNSEFRDDIVLTRANIGVSAHFNCQAKFFGDLNISNSNIDGNLDLKQGLFTKIDGTGVRIGGALLIAGARSADNRGRTAVCTGGQPNCWTLRLQGAKAAVLSDNENPETWPLDLNIDGFDYERVTWHSGMGCLKSDKNLETTGPSLLERPASMVVESLLSRSEPFSVDPYQRLSRLFNESGYVSKANEIAYVGALYKHEKIRHSFFSNIVEWMKFLFIGYGYRTYYSLYWILGFWSIGTLLAVRSGQLKTILPWYASKFDYWTRCALYSIDLLLPFVSLDKRHFENIHNDGLISVYFALHKFMGYVMGSFVLAGLLGLVK